MPLEASDVIAVQQLYAAYSFAADQGDGKAFAGCFTPDGAFDIGASVIRGAQALEEFGNGLAAAGRHFTSNVSIEGDGDVANGRAYVALIASSSSPPAITVIGQYQDRLARTSEGWRFVERRFLPDGAPA